MAYYLHTIKEIKRLNSQLKSVEMDLMLLDCTTEQHGHFQLREKDIRQQRSELMRSFHEGRHR